MCFPLGSILGLWSHRVQTITACKADENYSIFIVTLWLALETLAPILTGVAQVSWLCIR